MRTSLAVLLAAACLFSACGHEATESAEQKRAEKPPLAQGSFAQGQTSATPARQSKRAAVARPARPLPADQACASDKQETGNRHAEVPVRNAVETMVDSSVEARTADADSPVPATARPRPALRPIPIPAKHRISAAMPERATRIADMARNRDAMDRTPSLSLSAAGRSSAKNLVATGACPDGKLDKFKDEMEKSELPSTPVRKDGAAMRQEPDAGAGR